jgi:hypothetical protein
MKFASKTFERDEKIGRYQIRFRNGRFVVISDTSDSDSNYGCDDRPLVFLVYEQAICQMRLLMEEYRKAKLDMPIFEIVGFDYHGQEKVISIYTN